MRKLSTFQIILLVIFGAFAISGVLIFALAIGGGGGNSVGAVKIWGTLDRTAFTAVIRQAAEANGQLSEVTYEQKDPKTYESDLTNALASGTGPDLFLLRQDYALKDAGKIALIPSSALSRSQFENTFIEAADAFLTPEGVLAVPLVADPLVLYWNKDMLATAGFAQPPQYWDELFSMAQKISKKNDAGSLVKSTIAFGESQNVNNAKDILVTLIMQAGGSITGRDSTGRLVPALVSGSGQAANSALRFYTEFADPSKLDYSWNRSLPNARDAFAAGDLALYVGYASEAVQIVRGNPNLNFALAPLPQQRLAKNSITGARVYALAAARAGKNPVAAITAAFLLAAPGNARPLSIALGMPVARRDVLAASLPKQNDLGRTFALSQSEEQTINQSAMFARSWLDPDPERTAQAFRAMIENTTSGALLAGEAVQRADQEIAHIIGL